MVTSQEVGQAGEEIVALALVEKGYRTNVDTKGPGSTDIEALGANATLLVQVKTALFPATPAGLSSNEERNIKSRASRLGFEAWEARLQVNQGLHLVGAIGWRRV